MKLRHLAVAFLVVIGMTGVALAGDADFKLMNKTGYAIREIYISPTHKSNWGSDKLGRDVLDNGEARTFRFGDKGACHQDIKVVFDDDESEVVWEDFNLCELTKITLKYNRKTNEVSAESE